MILLITSHTCSPFYQFKKPDMVKGRDFDYKEEMNSSLPHDCVPVSATDPIYLLYTSGTTGMPKVRGVNLPCAQTD